ncbi:DUF3127 domain-containing protein, partial [Paracoccaceae bacterium]|nr:DUF3127 domain-containing protein [Paracoccaceae bacterium]
HLRVILKGFNMEIKGKIIEVLPEKSGQSENGKWRKQEYVLETDAQYPKKVCFMAWGDKVNQFNIKKDENVEVSIDVESREYNGRWYTDVKAWKVSRIGADAETSYSSGIQDQNETSNTSNPDFDNDTIPF